MTNSAFFPLSVVRKLQEFELPYVSITSSRSSEFHIVLQKRYVPPLVYIMSMNLVTSFFFICGKGLGVDMSKEKVKDGLLEKLPFLLSGRMMIMT